MAINANIQYFLDKGMKHLVVTMIQNYLKVEQCSAASCTPCRKLSKFHLFCFWVFQSILTGFYNGCLWENIFGSILKQPTNRLKNNTVLSYIRVFSATWTVGNLWTSEASLIKLDKLKHSSALPNINRSIIVQYYFCDKCNGYLCMLPNIFSYKATL